MTIAMFCAMCRNDYFGGRAHPFSSSELAWSLRKGVDLRRWDMSADTALKTQVAGMGSTLANASDFRIYRCLNRNVVQGFSRREGGICHYCRTLPLALLWRRIRIAQGWWKATLYVALLATVWRKARAPRSLWQSFGRGNWEANGKAAIPRVVTGVESPESQHISKKPAKEIVAGPPASAPAKPAGNPIQLLGKAKAFSEARQWERARDCASQAIDANPALLEAYAVRALAHRVIGSPELAVADYDRILDLAPENAEAWMFRGACKTQQAASAQQPLKDELMRDAHGDYKRAAELQPTNELAWLARLEFEICMGDYRSAIGTTGKCWKTVGEGPNKVVCAWLGAIAMILGGRPESRWSHFLEFVERDQTRLSTTLWSVAEIEGHLRMLPNSGCEQAKLDRLNIVHKVFLKHFGTGGPGIR